MTIHVFTISTQTLNGAVASTLTREIQDAGLTNLDYWNAVDDTLTVIFTIALTGPETTTLTSTVAAHDGVEPVDSSVADFEEADASDFKTFVYDVNGRLDRIDIYADAARTQLAFVKQLNYTGDDLDNIALTRQDDLSTTTKQLTYTGLDLTSIDIT